MLQTITSSTILKYTTIADMEYDLLMDPIETPSITFRHIEIK